MVKIKWTEEGILVLSADLPLAEVIRAIEKRQPAWVVLRRRRGYLYAYRPYELRRFWGKVPRLKGGKVEVALGLREEAESRIVRRKRRAWSGPPSDPSLSPILRLPRSRVIQVDTAGTPTAVGHPLIPKARGPARKKARGPVIKTVRRPALRRPGLKKARQPMANGEEATSAVPLFTASGPPEDRVDAVLSAKGPDSIAVGETALIDVRLELSAGARPLEHVLKAPIGTTEQIAVILIVPDDIVQPAGPRLVLVDPPTAEEPRQTAFTIHGKAPGSAPIDILFRQGASDLGTISFTVTVTAAAARSQPVAVSVNAAPRDERDDETLLLLVEEQRDGDVIRYRYMVFSRTLNLHYQDFESPPIQPRGGSVASASLAYVQSIYRRVVERVLQNSDDLALFARELKGIGTEMSRQLLDPDLVRLLWGGRQDIAVVWVTSREPYIPWELLRLEHPDSREVDDQFLCEYGLVRTFRGKALPRTLRRKEWRYLVATYPNRYANPVGDEVGFLTTQLPSRGITPRPIPPEPAALLDSLARPDFDVLHISCHGTTELQEIEQAQLIINDRLVGTKVHPVTVDPTTVRGEARLESRRPLIFLNACETGQQAPSLTDWGGWPKTFFDVGAGAFVGTSWEVRERPAVVFSEAFYTALLDGRTLAEAARAGRAAAKDKGDASWLAFVVYGHPMAQMNSG